MLLPMVAADSWSARVQRLRGGAGNWVFRCYRDPLIHRHSQCAAGPAATDSNAKMARSPKKVPDSCRLVFAIALHTTNVKQAFMKT